MLTGCLLSCIYRDPNYSKAWCCALLCIYGTKWVEHSLNIRPLLSRSWQGITGCDGRVVKALDLKSNGIFPRRFELCSQRILFSTWSLQVRIVTVMWKDVNYHHIFLSGGPRVVVSTAAIHARARGSVPGLGGLKETKMFLPHPRVKVSIAGSLRDREVACSTSDRQGSNFESCVWRTVSSQSSHHPQEVLQAQFSLFVHKGGLKPDSFHLSSYLELDFLTPPDEMTLEFSSASCY